MRKPCYALFLLLAAAMIAGCASSRQAAKPPHPMEGAWDFSIDTPQGVYTGVLAFTEVADVFSGTIAFSQQPDQPSPLQELVFAAPNATFKFDSGEYGIISVSVAVDGDAFDGTLDVPAVGAAGLPITGTRKVAE